MTRWSMTRFLTLTLAILAVIGISFPARPQTPEPNQAAPTRSPGLVKSVANDFDIREQISSDALPDAARPSQGTGKMVVEQRKEAVAEFLSSSAGELGPGLKLTLNQHGLPKSMFHERAALTAPSQKAPEEIARDFLRAYSKIFAFTSNEIENLRLVAKDVQQGAVFLSFNQTLNGIDVFRGHVKIVLNPAGQVVHAGVGEVVPSLTLASGPTLRADEAVKAALNLVGMDALPELVALAPRLDGRTAFGHPKGDPYTDITAELVIFPMTPGSARLAYRIFLEVDAESWFEMLVDAGDGRLLFRHNLYQSGSARVWKESPLKGTTCPATGPCAREVVMFPDGWVPGTATVTTGNNVDAFVDANADDVPDGNAGPGTLNGRAFSGTQEFDFPAPDGATPQDPTGFKAAAVANVFYFANAAHDYFYGLGFDEAAGNFQTDNFSRGGLGNDSVLATAQYGSASGLRNNSSFASTPDGIRPRMRIFIFSKGSLGPSTYRDGAYDGQVVLHEYTHGVSNRLVGNRTDTSCLGGTQSGALGEGWSDYFAISFYNNPVFAGYSWLDPVNGIRRHSYDGYKFSYEDVGNAGFEVHNDGEIWTATLWDLRTALGQVVTDRLVINGLKATPCRPSMIDARDAILAADRASSGGANRAKIWEVFARHGMGSSAGGADGSFVQGAIFTAAYDQPPDLQPGNRNPIITGKPPDAPSLGDSYAYRVGAADPDGGQLSFDFSPLRDGELSRARPAGMTIDSGSGQLMWTAGFLSERVKVTVTDGQGGMVIHGFRLVVITTLLPGAPVSISAPRGTSGIANFTVPAGTPVLQVSTRGIGDADLFVFDPDGKFAGSSERSQSNETVSVAAPKAGRWIILAQGFKGFQDVRLTASSPVPQALPGNSTQSISGDDSSENFFRLTVPPGATSLRVSISGSGPLPGLLIGRNRVATCQLNFDFFRTACSADYGLGLTSPTVGIQGPPAGDYNIGVYGFLTYRNLTFTTELMVPPTLVLGASTLSFSAADGGPAPAAQALTISDATGGSSFSWTAQATTASGGPWLQLSLTSGTGSGVVQASANPAGLSPGTYRGTITVTATPLAASPQTVAVTLTVTGRPILSVRNSALAFVAARGQNPAPQSLPISNSGGGALSFTVSVSTSSGGNWLVVTPTSGQVQPSASLNLIVSAQVASLAGGVYRGTITVNAAGAGGSPAVIAVTLTVDAPVVSNGGVVSAASFVVALSRGGITSLFGSLLANVTAVATEIPLPTSLGGVRVLVGGVAAPLFFVSATQINFQIPFEAPLQGNVSILVERDGLQGAALVVTVSEYAPGVFTYERVPGTRDPIIVHLNGQLVTPDNPAVADELLIVYATGVGNLNNAPPSGAAAPGDVLATARLTPSITLGGLPVQSLFAGLTPGLVGLVQFNIRLPAALPPTNRLPLVIRFGTSASPSVDLAVR